MILRPKQKQVSTNILELNLWCSGEHAHLECHTLCVRALIGSNQKKKVFVASPLSTQHYGERANTGWLGIRIMCQSGRHVYPQTVVSVS